MMSKVESLDGMVDMSYVDGSRAGVQTGLRATSGTGLKVGVSEE